MSGSSYPAVHKPTKSADHPTTLTSYTHHMLHILLIEEGEPWKSVEEGVLDTDFLYCPFTSWAALYRRIAVMNKDTEAVKKLPDNFYKGRTSLLYRKSFVKYYYRVLADEIAKEGRRTGKTVYSTDEVFNDTNLRALIQRANV